MSVFEPYLAAIEFAMKKHKEKVDRSGSLEIGHCLRVAQLVGFAGYDFKCMTVAVLHDIFEKTDATEEEIREFGDDVLEAVKLLTKTEDISSNEEIDVILANRTASIVKSCDLIAEIYDVSHSEDKDWARPYVKKADIRYYGKFCNAVDKAIDRANNDIIINPKPLKKMLDIDERDFTLYSDAEEKAYKYYKELYAKFDFDRLINKNKEGAKFYFDDFTQRLIGFYKPDWASNLEHGEANYYLGKGGWIPMEKNPWHTRENADDLWEKTREEVDQFIQNKVNENWFYDFVEIEKL